ncbi:DMT family transporter [Paenibacillus chondroitinus]|uniref:DMT family transporter n=1 Tax=Paenibacillus chondroitinus TaxID=59842 RepID=A0ABU6DB92_9BACL|nr:MULTISPECIES: DMT family transporter [Paenibacillus]MCY9662246.1 DMT family transporter [Paenibacillus anseongense]MEB4794716.1 DMT family transporter [Paenibacillus chondroitinus]
MDRLMKSALQSHPFILLAISILSVSISSIMIKFLDSPTSVAGMYRLFISVILMLAIVPWRRIRSLRMDRKEWGIVLLAGLFLGLHFLFWMESLVYTSVASSMVILSLQPLFVMIGSYLLFKEQVNRLMAGCLIVALLGSILIAWGDIGISKAALIGDGLSLAGTLFVSVYLLAGQKISHKIDANVYSIIVFFIGGTVLLLYNVMNHIPLTGYDSSEWTYFLLLAIIPTLFGQYIFNLLLKSVGATTVSVGIIGEPVLAIILAYLLLGEAISLFQFLGGMLTLFGMGMYFWFKTLTGGRKATNRH